MSDDERELRHEMEKDSELAKPTGANNAQVEATISKMEKVEEFVPLEEIRKFLLEVHMPLEDYEKLDTTIQKIYNEIELTKYQSFNNGYKKGILNANGEKDEDERFIERESFIARVSSIIGIAYTSGKMNMRLKNNGYILVQMSKKDFSEIKEEYKVKAN